MLSWHLHTLSNMVSGNKSSHSSTTQIWQKTAANQWSTIKEYSIKNKNCFECWRLDEIGNLLLDFICSVYRLFLVPTTTTFYLLQEYSLLWISASILYRLTKTIKEVNTDQFCVHYPHSLLCNFSSKFYALLWGQDCGHCGDFHGIISI